jgi:hypothetical protein
MKKATNPEAAGDLMESEKKSMAVLAGIKISEGIIIKKVVLSSSPIIAIF